MTISNQYPDRGKRGPTPRLTRLADESFLDYIKDTRSLLMHGHSDTRARANEEIKKAGIKFEPNNESVESIREVIRQAAPEAGILQRVQKSTQQALWKRVSDSYDLRKADLLRMYDDYDDRGPGSVTWDPEYVYPEYSKVETHLQTGGFVGDELSGLAFDYGTIIFHGKAEEGDLLHTTIAKRVEGPLDGKVGRIMDIGAHMGSSRVSLSGAFPKPKYGAAISVLAWSGMLTIAQSSWA